ncbi:MAG: SUMF1/EgtB/PvdO family nonheme iron enzyme [Deltaproteobacteria bacterium]|nr:SUMF1/EgtB/PvdO family nonheme iron enzyme [Deltaproteobacteria bacterium]
MPIKRFPNAFSLKECIGASTRLVMASAACLAYLVLAPAALADSTGNGAAWLLDLSPDEPLGADIKGMVFVKGGCFQMGDMFFEGEDDERPIHNVCLGDYYIGAAEVTQGQWTEVMDANPSRFNSCRDCPAEQISWGEARAFAEKLAEKTGISYRLPTEAEWEYAARGGGVMERFAGTSAEQDLGQFAWQASNSGEKTHMVKQKRPNAIGLYDMSGNAWEWVADCYAPDYYKTSPKDNPQGPSRCGERVLRGGSIVNAPRSLRATFRYRNNPDIRYHTYGLRLAADPGRRQ